VTAAVILILSGVLIGAGLNVLWRDIARHRRRAFVSERDMIERAAAQDAEAEAEVVISHTPAEEATPALPGRADPSPPPDNARAETLLTPPPNRLPASLVPEEPPAAPADTGRGLSLEQQWAALSPVLASAIERVNAVMAPLQLAIGAMGEPAWSYKNKGFGGYRRLLLGDESIAWLRIELSGDGLVHANVKAHKDDRSGINASAQALAVGLGAAEASDLLSQCLKPAVASAAGAVTTPPSEAQTAGIEAWNRVDATVTAALKATNGALAQAGARFITLGPVAWAPETRRYRLTLAVEVAGEDVARMLIERLVHEMEVSVGVRDANLIELGRRRRIPVEGLTIHSLAELIAACAWPTIARFRENRRSA
jgi:hypothetical protein